jgi:hypothetical protein
MVNAAKFRRSFRAAPYASEAKRTMSVLENLPSLIDRPRRSRRTTPSRRGRHHHRRSRRPPELHRPPRTGNHEKGIGDGAAGDLTIVRPAAAAPPRRPEQVGRHRAAQPLARARQQRAWSTLTMSVLENLPSLIDRPRRSRRTTPSRRGRHHHRRSRQSVGSAPLAPRARVTTTRKVNAGQSPIALFPKPDRNQEQPPRPLIQAPMRAIKGPVFSGLKSSAPFLQPRF